MLLFAGYITLASKLKDPSVAKEILLVKDVMLLANDGGAWPLTRVGENCFIRDQKGLMFEGLEGDDDELKIKKKTRATTEKDRNYDDDSGNLLYMGSKGT